MTWELCNEIKYFTQKMVKIIVIHVSFNNTSTAYYLGVRRIQLFNINGERHKIK